MNTNMNKTNANEIKKLTEKSSVSEVFEVYGHERKSGNPKCMRPSDFRMSDSCGNRTRKIHDIQFPDWDNIGAVMPVNAAMIERRNDVASTVKAIVKGYTPAIVRTARPKAEDFGKASWYNETNVRAAIESMNSHTLECLSEALEDHKVFELALDAYGIVCSDAETINGRYKSACEGIVTLITMGRYDAALQQLKYLSRYPIYVALLTEISRAKSEEERLLAKAKERKEATREVTREVAKQAKDSLAAIGASSLAVALLKRIILK